MLGFRLRNPSIKQEGVGMPVWGSAAAQAAEWGAMSDPQLYAVQVERYARSDLVYMCVNKLAEMAAMQRLCLFNGDGEKDPITGLPTEMIGEHPFLDLWRRPNPWDSTFEFMEATIISLELTGNAYWHLDDGAKPSKRGGETYIEAIGEPVALWNMRPDRVTIQPDKDTYIKYYTYEIAGQKIHIDPSRVVHFKRHHPLRDYEGLSPIEAANYACMTDMEAQKSNWRLFKNAMRLSGIIESDVETVDPDQIGLMKKMLLEEYSGSSEKAHQVAFLWSQFKYKELGMSPRDAEFVEGAKLNRMRIFGIFGVHPSIVLSEDVNLANARVGEYVTKAFTLAPKLTRLSGDITPILALWGDEKIEARFTNVVPQDRELEASVTQSKVDAAGKLVQAFGQHEGVLEAQRLGLVSMDVNLDNLVAPAPPTPMAVAMDMRDGEVDALTRSFFRRSYP